MDIPLLDLDGNPTGVVDDYQEVEWTRRYYDESTASLRISRRSPQAALLTKRTLLVIEDDVYLIQQLESEVDQEGKATEMLRASARTPLPNRLCLPPSGQSHDVQTDEAGETALKHYVDNNCGPSAVAERQIPNLVIATDQARGEQVTFQARYNQLRELVPDLARLARLGWNITRDDADLVFDVYEGNDLTADVFLDLSFDTLLSQKYLTSDEGRITFAYVGGEGEAELRQIVESYLGAAEPEGWDRAEVFIDARDTDDGTTLAQRGEAELVKSEGEDAFEVEVNPYGSFRYGRDWQLGDLLTLRSLSWGLNRSTRVVGVVQGIGNDGLRSLAAELDRPWPTLKDRVQQEAQRPGATGLA